jgi:hypothetical protein
VILVFQSSYVSDRRDFGAFCNLHGVTHAVEVGVDQGNFAVSFLRQWRGEKLYLVDPYMPDTEGYFAHDREWDYQCVLHALGRSAARCRFIRKPSVEAVRCVRRKDVEEHRIGFIYIDADHSYGSVRADLEAWWPVLRPGGIMAGHDWNWSGVERAVMEFAEAHGADWVCHTHEKQAVDTGPSWYFFKPEVVK